MAKQNAGFTHEHIEKVVVAVCALFLIFAIYIGFISPRFSAGDLGPSELVAEVGTAADATIARFRTPPKPTDGKTGTTKEELAVAKLTGWYGPTRKSLAENAGVSMEVARAQAFPPLFISTTTVAPEDRHDIVKLVEPEVPVLALGETTFEFPVSKPSLSEYDGPPANMATESAKSHWVAVASQVNLTEQSINFKTEKYPAGSFLSIYKVHLQRLDLDEPWRGWEDVDTWLPYEPVERPAAAQAGKLREDIDTRQEYIARTTLPKRVSGDKIEYDFVPYLDAPPGQSDEPAKKARDWVERADRSGKDKNYEAAMIFARAAMKARGIDDRLATRAKEIYGKALRRVRQRVGSDYRERATTVPDMMMPIVAYDLTAVPGRRYQYRTRYEVLNQYANNAGELVDPKGASTSTLFSAWSPPSREVQIEGATQFFLTDANAGQNKVEVTVWKKSRRNWEKKSFRLAVGDTIGGNDKDFGTGAVIVDIRFNERVNGKPDTVLVYVAPDGSLREALLSVDKERDKRLNA